MNTDLMKTRELWPSVRSVIGEALGLDGHSTRRLIVPNCIFSALDDGDFEDADLARIHANLQRWTGMQGLPRPALSQTPLEWTRILARSLGEDTHVVAQVVARIERGLSEAGFTEPFSVLK